MLTYIKPVLMMYMARLIRLLFMKKQYSFFIAAPACAIIQMFAEYKRNLIWVESPLSLNCT